MILLVVRHDRRVDQRDVGKARRRWRARGRRRGGAPAWAFRRPRRRLRPGALVLAPAQGGQDRLDVVVVPAAHHLDVQADHLDGAVPPERGAERDREARDRRQRWPPCGARDRHVLEDNLPQPRAAVRDGDRPPQLRAEAALAQMRGQPAHGERINQQQDERDADRDADPAMGRHERPRARRRPGGPEARRTAQTGRERRRLHGPGILSGLRCRRGHGRRTTSSSVAAATQQAHCQMCQSGEALFPGRSCGRNSAGRVLL